MLVSVVYPNLRVEANFFFVAIENNAENFVFENIFVKKKKLIYLYAAVPQTVFVNKF